jgi:hypothetical protein
LVASSFSHIFAYHLHLQYPAPPRSFITAEFGTAEDAFHAMDKAKNNSGRLSERDFIEECQRRDMGNLGKSQGFLVGI